MGFIKIDAKEIGENPFEIIGERWLLLTAGDKNGYNMMTASWGGLGVLWGLDVATVYVRPQRHTYEFMERSDMFTLGFFPSPYREKLAYCGKVSGREVDKAAQCGLTPEFTSAGAVYFSQAELVMVCRKLYFADLAPENFLDHRIRKFYQTGGYHRIYVGEITKTLRKD